MCQKWMSEIRRERRLTWIRICEPISNKSIRFERSSENGRRQCASHSEIQRRKRYIFHYIQIYMYIQKSAGKNKVFKHAVFSWDFCGGLMHSRWCKTFPLVTFFMSICLCADLFSVLFLLFAILHSTWGFFRCGRQNFDR